MFYGFPFFFPCDSSALNRYKAWWWRQILLRKTSTSA